MNKILTHYCWLLREWNLRTGASWYITHYWGILTTSFYWLFNRKKYLKIKYGWTLYDPTDLN